MLRSYARGSFIRFNSVRILLLFSALALACTKPTTTADLRTNHDSVSPVASGAQSRTDGVEQELERRLKALCDGAQGTVGLSVVESGNTISINGQSRLPLYSVFKLPLAIAVLKEVEENRLRLDRRAWQVSVTDHAKLTFL